MTCFLVVNPSRGHASARRPPAPPSQAAGATANGGAGLWRDALWGSEATLA